MESRTLKLALDVRIQASHVSRPRFQNVSSEGNEEVNDSGTEDREANELN